MRKEEHTAVRGAGGGGGEGAGIKVWGLLSAFSGGTAGSLHPLPATSCLPVLGLKGQLGGGGGALPDHGLVPR